MRRADEAFVSTSRFDVRDRLGDGGGGVVYRAYDRTLARDVALKVMRDAQGDGMTRFRSSFAALKRLSHPNLVQLLDLVEDRGRLLLVMELVEGQELLDYVRREQRRTDHTLVRGSARFDEMRLRTAFLQLAQGLYALHADRKVHRDVKPGNVRVTPEGRAVLLDLDLSYDLDADSGALSFPGDARPVGTALYMAPEQASERTSFASDWYSFGVVIYEALTGMVPFRGSDLEILLKKQESAPTEALELLPELPRDLSSLAMDLLAAQPTARPAGAEVLRRLGVEEETVSQKLSLTSIVSARPAFVGREHELERLYSALSRARRGPYVVRVTGEPGVGKTTLCEELLRRLAHGPERTLALAGNCSRYPDRPHAAFAEPVARLIEALREAPSSERLKLGPGALRLLERMLGQSVIGLDESRAKSAMPLDPLEQRFRAIEALRGLFAAVSAARPVVLWLDNYQWADLDTQRLVNALLRSDAQLGLLVVLSEDLEPGQVSATLPSVDEVIALTGLTSHAARTLAEHLGERANGPRLPLRVPYFRDALPLAIQERVRYALYFGEAPSESLGLPALIDARVSALSADARRVLELVAVAYDPLPQEVVERASGMTRALFSRQLATLRVGSLVRCFVLAGEDHVAPSHGVLARLIEARAETPRPRSYAQLSAALALRDAGRPSARLLRFQSESGDLRAAEKSALFAAQESERALAFQRAAQLYSLAASLQQNPEDESAYALRARHADALSNAGWSLAAAEAYRGAGRIAKAADAIHMRQRSAEHFLRAGEHAVGLDAVSELLRCFDISLPKSSRTAFWSLVRRRAFLSLRGTGFREVSEGQVSARDLRYVDALWSAGTRLSMVDIMRGGDLLARGLTEALRVGEPQRVARALCTESWTVLGYKRGYIERMSALIEAARTMVERQPSPLLDGHLKLAEGMGAFARFSVHEATSRVRDAERVFRDGCLDAAWEISVAQVYQLIGLTQSARFVELSAKYESCVQEAAERGDLWGYAQLLTLGAVGVKLVRDLPNEAAEDVRVAAGRFSNVHDLHIQHMFELVASSYIELYRGVPRGLDMLEQRWSQFKRQFFLQVRFSRGTLYELRGRSRVLAARRRKDASLLRAADSDAKVLLAHGEPPERGLGHLLLANTAALRGQTPRAAELLKQGIAELESVGMEMWSLSARHALGRVLGGDIGSALTREAEQVLRARGVKQPVRFVGMVLPGFADE
jgi:Cdc6-like AAA superfamily ATPase